MDANHKFMAFSGQFAGPRDDNYTEQLKSNTRALICFLNQYKYIIDSYVSNFFVDDLQSTLPPSWWCTLKQLEPNHLASLLNRETWKSNVIWPLSLLAFRSAIISLSLDRDPNNIQTDQWRSYFAEPGEADSGGVADEKSPIQGDVKDGQLLNLEHCYRRHVKPKKQHEILQLGQVIRSLCNVCHCNHVVDVGAGQGHLSRLLSYGYGVQVTTIEAVGCHAPKAAKFDREVYRDMKLGRTKPRKKKKDADHKEEPDITHLMQQEPNHVIAEIDPSIPVEEFLGKLQLHQKTSVNTEKLCSHGHKNENNTIGDPEMINPMTLSHTDHSIVHQLHRQTVEDKTNSSVLEANSSSQESSPSPALVNLPQNEAVHADMRREANRDCADMRREGSCEALVPDSQELILTGLHACGDLTPTMLRVFVQCPQAVGLASVGCCYMKLSTECETETRIEGIQYGYPMSDFVRNLPGHELSYEAREMACHFVDCYHDRLTEKSDNLRTHVYRAALQEVILQKAPDIKHGTIKLTVKNAHQRSFTEYAETALKRLGIDQTLTAEQVTQAETRLARWQDVVAYYTLRLSLAPVVETLILIDRMIYLIEKGVDCCLLPIFDPKLSPRNFVLLARQSTR